VAQIVKRFEQSTVLWALHTIQPSSILIYWCVLIRAKISEVNEITPLSNSVIIFDNGWCIWEPRFELSATHCSVDVAWFPFDVQRCQLVFESWTLTGDELNVTISDDHVDMFYFYLPSDEWTLQCACW